MVNISDRIKDIRKSLGYTQEQFAEKLGIKRSSIGAYEEGRAEPNIVTLAAISDLAGLSIDEVLNRKSVTVKDVGSLGTLIPLVPIKAAAGYQVGFPDDNFVQELPHFSLPILGKGDFRAFEISGDSMLPLTSGTIVVGERVKSASDIKDGKTYVLVTRDDGIVYKRVFNYIKGKGVLQLVSDNSRYKPYSIEPLSVSEIWLSRAYISRDFPVA